APAGVNLRLHDAREAEALRRGHGLVHREASLPVRHGDSVVPEQLLALMLVNVHRRNRSFSHLTVVWRPISAMAWVRGISFGHASTQFWALPQSAMPPGPMRAASRSSLFIAPVGCRFMSSAWPMADAPMKPPLRFTCGQTSRQRPHVMQRSSE